MSVGETIKAMREKKGWSRHELDRRAKLSHGHISTIERNPLRRPLPRTLAKIAKALGVPISDLVPAPPNSSFGKRVQQFRMARGWSAADMAKKLRCTERAVHLREQRDIIPEYVTVVGFATIFGVEADELYEYPEK